MVVTALGANAVVAVVVRETELLADEDRKGERERGLKGRNESPSGAGTRGEDRGGRVDRDCDVCVVCVTA